MHKNTKQFPMNPNYLFKPLSTYYCEFSKLTFTFNPVKKLGQTWVVYKRLEVELVRMCVKLKKKFEMGRMRELYTYLVEKKFCIFQFVVQAKLYIQSTLNTAYSTVAHMIYCMCSKIINHG